MEGANCSLLVQDHPNQREGTGVSFCPVVSPCPIPLLTRRDEAKLIGLRFNVDVDQEEEEVN